MAHELRLTIIFLLFPFSASSQMSDSLANYYYYVNQAELMISDNNLLGAEKKYERAEEFKINWYGRDYYNLALLKLKLDRLKEMVPILEKLAKNGFNVDLLLQKESFRTFFETRKGSKLLKKLKTVESTYNVELRAVYDSLYVEDSIANEKYNDLEYNFAVGKVDSSNIELFMRLINDFGFPSEDLIGIYSWFSFKPIVAIMNHHNRHQQIGRVEDFSQLIIDSGDKGLINSYAIANLFMSTSSYNQFNSLGVITQWKIKDHLKSTEEHTAYSDSMFTYNSVVNEEVIEQALKSSGLPTFKECLKLSTFNWEFQHDFILGRGVRNTYVVDDDETFRIFKSNSTPIEVFPY
jgi:hypothetical protein